MGWVETEGSVVDAGNPHLEIYKDIATFLSDNNCDFLHFFVGEVIKVQNAVNSSFHHMSSKITNAHVITQSNDKSWIMQKSNSSKST